MGRGITSVRYDFGRGVTKVRVLSKSRRGTSFTVGHAVVDTGKLTKEAAKVALEEALQKLLA